MCKIVLLDFVHHSNYKMIKLRFGSWIISPFLSEDGSRIQLPKRRRWTKSKRTILHTSINDVQTTDITLIGLQLFPWARLAQAMKRQDDRASVSGRDKVSSPSRPERVAPLPPQPILRQPLYRFWSMEKSTYWKAAKNSQPFIEFKVCYYRWPRLLCSQEPTTGPDQFSPRPHTQKQNPSYLHVQLYAHSLV
jgi:hypothetical protein